MDYRVDIESASFAGYLWDPLTQSWGSPDGASKGKKGLPVIGVVNYAYHPSTHVLCLAYGKKIWWAGDPPPLELWDHVEAGGKIHAMNSLFEFNMWSACLVPLGWPKLELIQLLDVQPRARAWGLPGGMDILGKILPLGIKKDTEGKRLMRKFSMPRKPTKANRNVIIRPEDEPEEAEKYGQYCLKDVAVETKLGEFLPELSDFERRVWESDQRANMRGVPVDLEALENAAVMMKQGETALNAELAAITEGAVDKHSLLSKLKAWCETRGEFLVDMTADTITEFLEDDNDIDPCVKRALEIRQTLASVSCKKVHAMRLRHHKGRLHDQLTYCGADRTGRFAAYGCQLHNTPRGLDDWTPDRTLEFFEDIKARDYSQLAAKYLDPFKALSSSIRGFICAEPGYILRGADYGAIEAVVLAEESGEQWRIDVFNGDGRIYEASASAITGTSVEEYAAYFKEHDKHHPDRGMGKVAELASGFHGGTAAWLNFGANKHFTPEICEPHTIDWESRCRWAETKGFNVPTLQEYVIGLQVKKWRKASPMIVKFWDGVIKAAVDAVRSPGTEFKYRRISYVVEDNVLYCKLPSGRRLAYHKPSVTVGRFGGDAIQFYAWNSGGKKNTPIGWAPEQTYSGKLTENIAQAIARDILCNAYLECDNAGLEILFSVHDELITQSKLGHGDPGELSRAMLRLPDWCSHYGLTCSSWQGERFRK